LIEVPDGLNLAHSAALLHDVVTALVLAERLAITADDTVLVVGASGGLGVASVQLARAIGARVIAVARDERKLARIRELGTDAVIDSEQDGWVERVRAVAGDGVTVVLDNIGGAVGEAAFDLVVPGGRFSAHGTPSGRFAAIDPEEAQRRGITLRGILDVQLDDAELKRYAAAALAEAAAGRVAPVIGQTFPLEKAADAHAAIENRTVFGKTLLVIS
jgi:NADPH2:quinone reductase